MGKSIITSMYNRKPGTLEVIDRMFFPSLVNNASSDTELIIMDDCSPLERETKEIVEKHLPDLRKFGNVVLKRNPKNLGFAGSFNQGIQIASGNRLLIVNDDVYLPRESVSSLLETLSEDQNIGLVGPITNASTYTAQYCTQAPKIRAYSPGEFARLDEFAKEAKRIMKGERIATDWVSGFCMAADADKLKEMRAFDEKFRYGVGEDLDLGKKMSQKYSVIINPEIFVGHGGVTGTHVSLKQQPLKAAFYSAVNALIEGKSRGFLPMIAGHVKGLSMLTGKDTVSELYEKKAKD